MSSKSSRYIIIALISVVYLLTIAIFFEDQVQSDFWLTVSVALTTGILAPFIAWLVDGILINITNIKLWFQTQILYRRASIRFSLSYIFRIRVNDKYLLVKNSKWNFYQPVGGVYKVLPGELSRLQENYKIELDKKLPTDGILKDDLRVFVPAKNALSFHRWFKTGKNREISHWREFCEELVKPGILKFNTFPHINYRYVGTIKTPLKKSSKLNCREILSYDVFDIILNPEQEKELVELLQKGNSDAIKWADEILINSLGFDERNRSESYDIGAHTKWTLNMKYS